MMGTEIKIMGFGKPPIDLDGYVVPVVADPVPPLGVGYSFQGTRRQVERVKARMAREYPGIVFHTEIDLQNGQFYVRAWRVVD